jgi:hypothetical protein
MKKVILLVMVVLGLQAVFAAETGAVVGKGSFFHTDMGHQVDFSVAAKSEGELVKGFFFHSHDGERHLDKVLDMRIDRSKATLLTQGDHGFHVVVLQDGRVDKIGLMHFDTEDAARMMFMDPAINLDPLTKGRITVSSHESVDGRSLS